MRFFRKLLFRLGVGNHKFDRNVWEDKPQKRKLFIKNIIESKMAIGMSREQVNQTFGNDRREYINGVWDYAFSTFKGGETKEMLCFYFDRNNRVTNIKIKYKKKLR